METTAKFKALSDKTRLRIMGLLQEEDLCVCEVMEILEMTQSRISRHMGILKQAGLVSEQRAGRWVICRLENRESPFLSLLRSELENDPEIRSDRQRMKEARARRPGPPVCEERKSVRKRR